MDRDISEAEKGGEMTERKLDAAESRSIISDAVGAHADKHKATPGSCTGWICWYEIAKEAVAVAYERGITIPRLGDERAE